MVNQNFYEYGKEKEIEQLINTIPMKNRKKEILQNVNNVSLPLIIYGTGMYAKQVSRYLEENEIKIAAACVDDKYYKNNTKFLDGIPVYPVEELVTKLKSFNVIIGFSEFHIAETKRINGCEEIFFLDSKANFDHLSNLPKVIDQLRHFFKDNPSVFNIKNIIHLYFACLSSGVEFLHYIELGDEIHLLTKEGLHLITDRYFWVFNEIFSEKQYAVYKKYNKSDYVVFDIGANRGYSALYFAQDENCQRVFCFEPDINTFAFLQKNVALNPKQAEKIKTFNYGLFDKADMLTFYQPQDGSDAVNTSKMDFGDHNWSEERKRLIKENILEVKRASEAIADLLARFVMPPHFYKIIKIDIEGAEYEVLGELKESGLIRTFSVIIGESHFGMERILDICDNDFDLVYLKKGTMDGVFIFLFLNKSREA